METCIWIGISGKQYTYEVYASSADWKSVAGNYIFASVVAGRWKAHYIGQTNDFKNRFSSHEKWIEAVRAGATHILAHVNTGEALRLSEESDLIQSNNPSCNVQLQPDYASLAAMLNRGFR